MPTTKRQAYHPRQPQLRYGSNNCGFSRYTHTPIRRVREEGRQSSQTSSSVESQIGRPPSPRPFPLDPFWAPSNIGMDEDDLITLLVTDRLASRLGGLPPVNRIRSVGSKKSVPRDTAVEMYSSPVLSDANLRALLSFAPRLVVGQRTAGN